MKFKKKSELYKYHYCSKNHDKILKIFFSSFILSIGEKPKPEEIEDKIEDFVEAAETEEKEGEITSSRESVIEELTSEIYERPVAEGQSPVSSEKPSLVDESVEQSQDLNLEKENEGATREIQQDFDLEGEGLKGKIGSF